MTRSDILTAVRELVAELHEPMADEAPLELDSLTVVMLVEAIEDQFGIRFEARDVIPEHFATIAALAGFVERKQG